MRIISLVSAMLLFQACGEGEQPQLLDRFAYDIRENNIDLEFEFNRQTELNLELTIPVRQYGTVSFSPSTPDSGFVIGIQLNMEILQDSDLFSLERTRRLPNDQRMSNYVTDDVARMYFKPSERVGTSLYLPLETDKLYMGAAVELDFMNEDFPSELVITQRIMDTQNRWLGVVSFFGPKVRNGSVIRPGGFFVMTNARDIADALKDDQENGFISVSDIKILTTADLVPYSETYINQDEYYNPKKLRKLLKQYDEVGKEEGYIDE